MYGVVPVAVIAGAEPLKIRLVMVWLAVKTFAEPTAAKHPLSVLLLIASRQ
jgi:hypothetical protein